MKTILHAVDIAATPDTVFDAVATEEGLTRWWSTDVDADARVGGRIRFRFIPVFNPVMEVTELEKGRRVGWKCVDGHDPWKDNTFRFEIEERDEGSILFFRQHYEVELSDEEYGRYNFNWGYYLRSLKLLCEEDEGMPFEPDG